MLNKDFYSYIPKWMTDILDKKIEKYRDDPEFPKAWDLYRNICRSKPLRAIPDPDGYFESFFQQSVNEANFSEDDAEDILVATDDNPEEMLSEPEEIFTGEILSNEDDALIINTSDIEINE